jgi:MFS family permease
VLGLVTAYWTDYGTSGYESSFRYRFPLSLQILFCVIQLATIPFLPESPRWLVVSNRLDQAKEVIAAIHNTEDFASSTEAVQFLVSIEQAVLIENDRRPAYKDMFTMGPLQNFRRILLAFGLQAMQQLSGINVIAYYSTVVFEQSVKTSPHLALVLGGLTAIAFLCGTIIAVLVVDKLGRRPVCALLN